MLPNKRIAIVAITVIGVPIVLFAIYTWLALNWTYSDGDRSGQLQKFSKRGWLCKTWEGELALVTMPGAIPEKFFFTVRDEGVAKQVAGALGKRVVLTYAQHKGIPTSCFGDTEYFIEKVVVPG